MRKVIIDTDPGHDDALALMLMVKSGLFDILAVTTVAGNSTIENVTKNTTYIFDLLQSRSIPIYSGRKNPLKRRLIQAVVHGMNGLDGADTKNTSFELTDNAPEKIIELVRKNPNIVTLLALGPLSNLALAFKKDPKLPSLIKEVVIMGGAINAPGNKNRVAEFNFFVDPEAADIVFKTYVKKILIPIDTCNKIVLLLNDFNKLKKSYLYKPIINMMKHFIRGIEQYEGTKGALVYDAVAAYYLINPNAFLLEPMDIVVETKGEHTFGMTVAERRISEKTNPNVMVAQKVDDKQFREEFISILNR